jgi:GNAT superfamily N-acetyltransferase
VATIRAAGVADAGDVAQLLDTFNREYDTPTPGVTVLQGRLDHLLAGDAVTALLLGEPPFAVALVTLRPNVWYDGPVGLLDELYVAPDQRNQGFGTALLKAAEDVVRRHGGEVLEINVDGDDRDARRFYERHGYRNTEPGRDEQLLYYFREFSAVDAAVPE